MYLELLRQDRKEIFRAAKDAQAITDLILDRHPRLRLEQGMAVPRTGSPVEQGVAVPRTGSPEPDGRMPATADPPAPIRTFDDLLIAHQRLIGGALREVVRRGDDEGYLGRLVRDLAAALPISPAVTTTRPRKMLIGKSRPNERAHGPVLAWG